MWSKASRHGVDKRAWRLSGSGTAMCKWCTLAHAEQTAAAAISKPKAEGWISNPKWRNMPEQMLAYRAGAFFARVHCPDVLMGCCVEGEADDAAPAARTVEDVL